MLELHLPGHPAVIRSLEARLETLGLRRAEPGEFTRRALAAGKLDLARAEAVMALIAARDDAERRQALSDLRGDASLALGAWTERLRDIAARYEVSFDFTEDEHADAGAETLPEELRALAHELAGFIGEAPRQPSRTRPQIALFGPANAGKSSLLNALLGEPRALVSELEGTTRDPVSAGLQLDDLTVTLQDLSGVGGADADPGSFAQTATDEALTADVLLLLCGPGQEEALMRAYRSLCATDQGLAARAIWVSTKSDLADAPAENPAGLEQVGLSALSGKGLDDLRGRLSDRIRRAASGPVTSRLRTGARAALAQLEEALAEKRAPPEAMAGAARRALRTLDETLMSDTPGEVLDLIFSRFCIGK